MQMFHPTAKHQILMLCFYLWQEDFFTMSGKFAFKGFLFQTFIALLEMLSDEANELEAIQLEPGNEAEQVDFIKFYSRRTVAVQVKSSKNQISLADAKKWARELKSKYQADIYQLVLVASTSPSVCGGKNLEGVEIPFPKQPEIRSLRHQAAHLLDLYLESRGFSKTLPQIRELMVDGLISKLSEYSTNGQKVSLAEIETRIKDWLLIVYPNSVEKILFDKCEILLSGIEIKSDTGSKADVCIVSNIEFANPGITISVVEDIRLVIKFKCRKVMYRPFTILGGDREMNNDYSFSEFFITPQNSIKKRILFRPVKRGKIDEELFSAGKFDLEVHVKYRKIEEPLIQKCIKSMFVSEETLRELRNRILLSSELSQSLPDEIFGDFE